MNKLFKSRKFWMAIFGVIAVVGAELAGVSEQATLEIAGLITAYILGQGMADWGKERG